jgi:outer membrane protein assembly factor BamB
MRSVRRKLVQAAMVLLASPAFAGSEEPAPTLVWTFDGASARGSNAPPDSEAVELLERFGFVDGTSRGPRYLAFDRAGEPRCAVAIDSSAAVLLAGRGRAVVVGATTADFLDERCQVRFSHPADDAQVLLDGEVLVVSDDGRLLFLDPSGKLRGAAGSSSDVGLAPLMVPAAGGGHLIVMNGGGSLAVFDPWGRRLGRISPGANRRARAVAGGPDRVYLAASASQLATAGSGLDPAAAATDSRDDDEVLGARALDGTLLWQEDLDSPERDVTGLWAWPDGRGVAVALTDFEPGRGRVVSRRLEARGPGGALLWARELDGALDDLGIDVAFAGASGDLAVTQREGSEGVRRAAVLVLAPGGRLRGLLLLNDWTRAGGAQLSAGGRYLLVNTARSGLLELYVVP